VVILCKLLCLSNRFIFLIPFPYPYITKRNTTIKPYPHCGVAYIPQCKSINFEAQIRLWSISCQCTFQVSTFIMIIIIGNIRAPVGLCSKAQVCRVSIVGIAGSNPVEGMDIRPLLVHCPNAEVAFCGHHAFSCPIRNARAGFSSWTVSV